jgi:hypothetical protein
LCSRRGRHRDIRLRRTADRRELLAGRIDVLSMVIGTEVGQNIRIIGVFGEKRLANLPDVPTLKEQGYNVSPASFGGLLAPPATPQPVLTKLSSACAEAAKNDVYATTARTLSQMIGRHAGIPKSVSPPISRRVLSRLKHNKSPPAATLQLETYLACGCGCTYCWLYCCTCGSSTPVCCGAGAGGFIAASLVQRSLNSTAPSGVYSLLRQVHGPRVTMRGA